MWVLSATGVVQGEKGLLQCAKGMIRFAFAILLLGTLPCLAVSRAPVQHKLSTVSSSLGLEPNDTQLATAGSVSSEEMMIHEPGEVIYNTSKTEESTMSQYRRKTLPKKMIVSFVNGIYHTEAEWREICDELKSLFNNEIRAFYNPSSGWWMKDAFGAGRELIMRPNDLFAARKLAEHLRMALREVAPNGRVLHLAHSGGAILTYLAAKYHLSVAETDRIDVATFGGGRSITRKYFKGRIVNYYARNDPLVILDRRAGTLVKKVPLEDASSPAGSAPPSEVKDLKHNTTFVFLRGIANNPVYDHSMTGPTYLRALNMEARDFRRRLADLKATEIKEAGLMRKLRKTASEITGVHHFWGNVLVDADLALRSVRKRTAAATGVRGFFSGKHRKGKGRPIIVSEIDSGKLGGNPGPSPAVSEEAAMKSLTLDVQEAIDSKRSEDTQRPWLRAVPALIGDVVLAVSRWWTSPVLVKVSDTDSSSSLSQPLQVGAGEDLATSVSDSVGADSRAYASTSLDEDAMHQNQDLQMDDATSGGVVVKYETSSGWGLPSVGQLVSSACQWARALMGSPNAHGHPVPQELPPPLLSDSGSLPRAGNGIEPSAEGEEERGMGEDLDDINREWTVKDGVDSLSGQSESYDDGAGEDEVMAMEEGQSMSQGNGYAPSVNTLIDEESEELCKPGQEGVSRDGRCEEHVEGTDGEQEAPNSLPMESRNSGVN